MVSLAVALWLLVRPYQGLGPDARLNAMRALGRLSPESLGLDVYLRFGSQGPYAVFSSIYAALIGVLGVEDAARLLTLIGQVWWLAAAFFISRRLLGSHRAFLALAVVAAVPGHYGASGVFQYAEPFLTSRLYAEAAVLSAVAVLLHRKIVPATILSVAALLLDAMMGAAGLLLVIACATPHSWRVKLLTAFGTCLVAVALVSVWVPHHPLAIFDDEWLSLVRAREPFILLSDWSAQAWAGVARTLIPLWILSAGWADARARAFFRSAVAVGILGIVATGIGASLFKVVLITQAQAWRWVWLACALLPIAAVGGLRSVWRAGPIERSAVLLALPGWLLSGLPALLLLALSAVVWAVRERVPGRAKRLILLACVAVATMGAIIWAIFLPLPSSTDPSASTGRQILNALRPVLADGAMGAAVVAGVWLALRRLTSAKLLPVAAASVAVAIAIAWSTLPDWLREDYAADLEPELAAWRSTIPEDAEVMWPEDGGAVWLLLQRRDFLSYDQTAGALYSRDAAMEMLSRAKEVSTILPPSMAFGAAIAGKSFRVTASSLFRACRESSVDFIVVRERLDAPLAAPSMMYQGWRRTAIGEPAYLYDCNQLRRLPIAG